MPEVLKDTFGRVHDYLRISLTDKCNLRCSYCMPENPCFMKNASLMTDAEIIKIAGIFVNDFGIKKIRLTGGEPLIREGIGRLLPALAELGAELGITTNGILLKENLSLLKNSGIASVNVSLDTLDPEKFNAITRRDLFREVKASIDAALESGMRVKVNTVALKGMNENEVLNFIGWTARTPVHIRFIEFMPFDGNHWKKENVLTQEEILSAIHEKFETEKLRDEKNSTARAFRIPGHAGTFAIISTVSMPFCESCNRVRLTADGKLRNCLFATREWDILAELRNGGNLHSAIREAVTGKYKERGGLPWFDSNSNQTDFTTIRSMVKIGG